MTFYLGYTLLYFNKTPPHTYFGNQLISKTNKEQLRELIAEKINSLEKSSVIFEIEGNKIETSLASLGVEFDTNVSLERTWSLAKSPSFKNDQLGKIKAIFVKTDVKPIYHIDFTQLSNFLDSLLSKYEIKAKNASINFEAGKIQVSKEAAGKVIDRSSLYLELRDRIEDLSQSPIILTQINDPPQINILQAQSALNKVEGLNNQRIVLAYGYDTWKLSGQTLLSILKFYPYGQEDGYSAQFSFGDKPTTINWLKLVDSPEPKLNINFDKEKLDIFIDNIAKSIDQQTINATLKFEEGRVVEFTPARDGQKLDRELTKKLVADKVSIDSISPDKDINIALPVKVAKAKIANEEINNLGIKELLGRGVSYFSGSITNRIYNISLGAKRINGTLIKPGELFSFNTAVGEVSGSTGYKQAYVISSGRTVLDDGGGICQVSTTVFRAALNSGLPIVKRTAHAYRVAYYEQRGFKPGLDATVWAPAVDLIFKNDTANHILVQTIVDTARARLEVDIYGTGDNRKVEITEPVISNVKPPPPDKYQEDPTLPKGTTKQVDFSAWGANSVFTRKVYKGDELIIDDNFKSYFRPWQAVYLVGTGG